MIHLDNSSGVSTNTHGSLTAIEAANDPDNNTLQVICDVFNSQKMNTMPVLVQILSFPLSLRNIARNLLRIVFIKQTLCKIITE